MRFIYAIITAALCFGSTCIAGDAIGGISWTVTGVSTGAALVVMDITGVSGKVLSVEIDNDASSTSTVSIVTVAGIGGSAGGAKTIFSGDLSADLSTNHTDTIYLFRDTVRLSVTNANANATTVSDYVVITLDQEQ